METVHPQVSIVLLSYNRPQLLSHALASLQQQSYQNFEVIVVDNPSAASVEVAQLVSQYPTFKLIQTDSNIGYAGGMNRGIASAAGDYVYLTEDDIVLESDCIDNLVRYLEDNPASDLIAPVIYNKQSRTIRCAGGELALDGVYQRKIYGAGEGDAGQFVKPFAVTYIDGATMFARREFWQRFKGFREEYFMYVEAVELCARVAKSGLRMAVVPEAKVYHFEPGDASTTPDLEFHKLKNFFSLYLLHAPARVLPEFVCRYAIINGMRSLFAKKGNSPRVFFKALLWVARKTPGLLRERYAARS
ncbi:MAG TPA: glycosyltransferase family 2 protein [Pyrinomonadaceae bacterium]|jgi:GT2 family glycosyltransferase|nr:glycosyltransferase family 2 protein [Pyrinomonadaceae bacterium]